MITKKITYVDEKGFEFTFEPIEDSLKIRKTKTGYIAKYLIQDIDVENPFENWDGVGRFYHWKDNGREELEKYCELLGYDIDTREKIKEDNPFAVRIDKYEHSSIWYSIAGEGTQCKWDTSLAWAVWYPDDEAMKDIKRFKTKKTQRKRTIELARESCELFNQWANGNVFCLVKETYDKNKEQIDYNTLGGCFGYEEALKSLKTDI